MSWIKKGIFKIPTIFVYVHLGRFMFTFCTGDKTGCERKSLQTKRIPSLDIWQNKWKLQENNWKMSPLKFRSITFCPSDNDHKKTGNVNLFSGIIDSNKNLTEVLILPHLIQSLTFFYLIINISFFTLYISCLVFCHSIIKSRTSLIQLKWYKGHTVLAEQLP